MGFCCCATWYSNWMLNRDFRLMIRVECISARAWLRQGQPRFLKQIAENLEESLRARFFLPLLLPRLRLSARRVNSICSDKQRPNMALIPCNWGWITICSPTLHKGVYSSTVFERVEWTRQSVSVRVAGVFYLTTIFWFLKSGFSAFYYIRIYRSTLRNTFPIKSFLETRSSIDQ